MQKSMAEFDGVRLRLATRADEPRVEALLTASDLPLDGVHEALDCFVVAEEGSDLVGVAGIEECGKTGQNALLRSVAVKDSWRGRGLGRALVTNAIAVAEQRGAKALYLLTTTADTYFPSFGFRQTTREAVPDDVKATKEFKEACPASATVMVREQVS
jgi:N-acetylglutamate synthase-like GNAT family acetyltransferase